MLYLDVASQELKPGDFSLPFLAMNHIEGFQHSVRELGFILEEASKGRMCMMWRNVCAVICERGSPVLEEVWIVG